MWLPDKTKLVKVRLHNQGEDVETLWAELLEPAEEGAGSRLVRLGNVPFLHAKPTYGDVIEVRPDLEDGMLDWDAGGVPFEEIGTRIHEDAGRWVVIVDYKAAPPAHDLAATFDALDIAGDKADIAVEGAFVQKDGGTARAYLAVPYARNVEDVVAWLRSPEVRLDFELVHPIDE